jgi:CheY-like chemotaxis protein
MNTLIIDDDVFLQKALSYTLLEAGHTVSLASDGKKAISIIEKNKNIDLIFCDVMMPDLTGPGFLLMLKKYFPKGMPVVVIISGVKDGENFLKTIDVKYDHFVKKPIDMPEMRKLIAEVRQPDLY